MKRITFLFIFFTLVVSGLYLTTFNRPSKEKISSNNTILDSTKYTLINHKFRYRLREIISEDFEIVEMSNGTENESSIEIHPLKARPVDFAWAGLMMKFEDGNSSIAQLQDKGYKKDNMFGKDVYIKDSKEENYLKEIIFSNLDKRITLKIYLNNPSTREEFDPIINEALSKLEFY